FEISCNVRSAKCWRPRILVRSRWEKFATFSVAWAWISECSLTNKAIPFPAQAIAKQNQKRAPTNSKPRCSRRSDHASSKGTSETGTKQRTSHVDVAKPRYLVN